MVTLRQILHALERFREISDRATLANLGLIGMNLADHPWFIPDGHLTHVPAPFLDSDEEVEIKVDEDAGLYRYVSPQRGARVVTRPLAEIHLYRVNPDAILGDMASLLGIYQTVKSRRTCLVAGHLWYLGDFRIGSTPASAPIFYGRALSSAPVTLLKEKLTDSIHEHAGIVLTPSLPTWSIVTRYPVRLLDDFLHAADDKEFFDLSALTRALTGKPAGTAEVADEWFDEPGGVLKLRHFPKPVTFTGYQKNIIAIFWRSRDGDCLEWTQDVKTQSGSVADTLDKAMGGKTRRELFIERTALRGCYRLRRR